MVVQTTAQRKQKDGKANWWIIDFGPIVDICQIPEYVPTKGAPTRGCLWSTATANSFCHKVSIYCIIIVFIVQILRKRLMTMLCYVLVDGQGLSVQRTLPHTCFPHIAINLPRHGPTRYNIFFYITLYINLCLWNYTHYNQNHKKVFHYPLMY